MNNCHTVCMTLWLGKYAYLQTSLEFITKQTPAIRWTRVTFTDSRWEKDTWQYLWKYTVPTAWQVTTSDKYLSNAQIVGKRLKVVKYYSSQIICDDSPNSIHRKGSQRETWSQHLLEVREDSAQCTSVTTWNIAIGTEQCNIAQTWTNIAIGTEQGIIAQKWKKNITIGT